MTDTAIHDVVMVGAGPTSLTAAIYTTREDIETLLLDKGAIGGLAASTDWVDNYPGFPEGIAGLELAEKLQKGVLFRSVGFTFSNFRFKQKIKAKT